MLLVKNPLRFDQALLFKSKKLNKEGTGLVFTQPIRILLVKGSHQKKTGKKIHNSCELWGGGQQILVCEPQKSAFLELIFQKTC